MVKLEIRENEQAEPMIKTSQLLLQGKQNVVQKKKITTFYAAHLTIDLQPERASQVVQW